ncbi:hypothetical protein H072_10240 [Dactylellina haptotyla CBS 200.50]|uniref:Sas10 C-terminal domain-containing protein n=1 Tax=Dactylellina haptotyla (strain CBS 200.50) TaxID=1284197 RepID=S8A575_DACHA|nr:hypothetical protein H072_10240 [Dactylellina haptotyla CBS 200.50]
MARKSKRTRGDSKPSGPRAVDPADAKVGKLTTYEDLADSEDEFYLNQDRVAFDEDPSTKRRRLNRDAAFEDSEEEEVLDLAELPSSDEEDEEDELGGRTANGAGYSDDDDEEDEEEIEDEYADWGKSRKNFYDANDIEDEEDAAMEEEEARRIQKRQLQSMSAQDFGVDESDWKQPGDKDANGVKSSAPDFEDMDLEVTVTRKIEIPKSDKDRMELMQLLHPEFGPLKSDYMRLAPLYDSITAKAESRTNPASIARKRWIILSAYLATLSMYFAFLTKPRPEGEVVDLRDHDIMDALLKWRLQWLEVEKMEDEATPEPETAPLQLDKDMGDMSLDDKEDAEISDSEADEIIVQPFVNSIKAKKEANGIKEKAKKSKSETGTKEAKRLAKSDARLKDLDGLLPSSTARQKHIKSKALVQFKDDDFGDEDFIYESDAEEKAKRKKSLKFYTAQIHQKSSKRDRAGRDAGGDLDLPRKERNKERMEKLNAEAQKRGTKDGLGSDLGGDSDYDDNDLTNGMSLKEQIEGDDAVENDALEFYNNVASKTALEKLKKKLEREAAEVRERVVETETIDPVTGKRAIGYTIEKNKGLTPYRKKDVRNPRVKKRKKFEAAKKKLGSKKAIYKPPTGAYSGEATGIRTKVIKSVKFS